MATIDIEVDGKKYIMEWYKPGELQDELMGYITITEACKEPSDGDEEHMDCELETYDFRGIE